MILAVSATQPHRAAPPEHRAAPPASTSFAELCTSWSDVSSDWNPGPFQHDLSPPALFTPAGMLETMRGAPLGFAWKEGGCRPRTCAKLTGVRVVASGEVRGMPHLQAQGARCTWTPPVPRSCPTRAHSPPLALSAPPPARAPSPAARGFTSVARTRVSDRQSLLESSCSPAHVLGAPHTSE